MQINPQNFILGGAAGAAFATVICHLIAVIIEFKVLKKQLNLKLDKTKFILKPIIATIIMAVVSNYTYIFLIAKLGEKLVLILTLLVAVIIFLINIFALKIFSKEEIYMLPFGRKIYDSILVSKK